MANLDKQTGVDIVRRACQAPIKAICNNAGEEGAVIVGRVIESDDVNYGYNAQIGEYCNMIDSGILDPTKVVKTVLQDAASVASLMATTEAAIADLPDDGKADPMAGMGGGGMG